MDNLIKNLAICLLPWNATAIRPSGMALPCCRFNISNPNLFLKESNINLDFRNSKKWIETREKMLLGEKIPSCFRCYRDEESGSESMRTLSLKEYSNENLNSLDVNLLPFLTLPTDINPLPISFLEIAFSNLCNLSCVSCNSFYSSSWATEDYRNGRSLLNKKSLIENNFDTSQIDLDNLSILKIIGGEPFMDQQKFISLLKKINLKKLTIIISTNGTILPNDELKSLLDQCNRVVLSVSLDGIGLVNDWYRWPSKFAKITEVLNQYTSWWGYNSKFLLEIHSVINIYNIWTLDEIVLFINEFYPLWGMDFDWIVTPTWQNISILPFSFKTNLIDKLNFWNEDIKSNVRFNKSNPFTVSIDRLNDNSIGSLEEFKSRSIMLAKERNLDLLEMIPHLKEIF